MALDTRRGTCTNSWYVRNLEMKKENEVKFEKRTVCENHTRYKVLYCRYGKSYRI